MIIADCVSNFTTSYGLPVSLFLAGLVGSVTHCSGMCSPFVLAQMGDDVVLKRPAGRLLIPYHLGRMVTYVFLAVLFGTILNLAFLFSGVRAFIVAPILLLAGILFLVSAFPALGQVFPWVVRFQSVKLFKPITSVTSRLMLRT